MVVYRDRDLLRVKRFMDSLQNQINQNFELIFIDYGSQPQYKQDVQILLEKYIFVKYIYTDTRGWFWNRAQALNLGIYKASTDNIVTLDIDLIVAPDFTAKINTTFSSSHYIRFSCYLLPKNINNFKSLFLPDFTPEKHYKQTNPVTGFGILSFSKAAFIEAGGYNQYYRLWGIEDIDFVKRLELVGITSQGFIEGLRIYHQWHPKSQPTLPKGWYEQMNAYFKSQNEDGKQVVGFQKPSLILTNDRPTLQFINNDYLHQKTNHFRFKFPKEQAFATFGYLFSELKTGEYIRIEQTFDLIANAQNTKWGKLFKRFNQLLAKLGVSYRWIDLEKYNSELITKEEVKNFLFHFLITWQNQIADYYLDEHSNTIILIIVKK